MIGREAAASGVLKCLKYWIFFCVSYILSFFFFMLEERKKRERKKRFVKMSLCLSCMVTLTN